jgi:predicted DNA-binding transcriptional regulator YafY
MRADRLLSLLMVLQTRGRTTARELARELEVTERTIYRDVTALSAAGVPVFSERGPGGGLALVENYRTNLTGLNPAEVRALFMLSIPAPLDQLGLGAELRSAMLKLAASLPKSRQQDEANARQRIHLDPSGWFQSDEPVPHLGIVQAALWQSQLLRISYRAQFGTEVLMEIAPYGLVAKANQWYLVGARQGQIRAWRVAHIQTARLSEQGFDRPADFDLPAFWENWCRDFETRRPVYRVRARVSPTLALILTEALPQSLSSPPKNETASNWVEIELDFENLEDARTRLLGYGGAVEVLEPLALRCTLQDFAEQISARYRQV